MKNYKFKIIIPVLIVLFVLFLLLYGLGRGGSKDKPDDELVLFAQCLTNKGVVMYGADWCPHCQNEKNAFGDAFRYINYVECPKNPQACLGVGIENYPTWILPDGQKLVGEQGVERLSRTSGCALR